MAVAERLSLGRLAEFRDLQTVILGLLAAFIAVDLIAKLAGFGLFVGPVKLLGGGLDVERLFGLVWDGIVVGLAIGLAGIGLSMTYSILSFANFAHGDYITSGAFAGWAVAWTVAGLTDGSVDAGIGYLLSVGYGDGPSAGDLGINVLGQPLAILLGLVVAILATVALVLLVDRIVFEPMRDQGGISLLIASIGVALALRYTVVFLFGPRKRGLTAGGEKLILGGANGQLVLVDSRGTLIQAQNGQDVGNAFFYKLPLPQLGDYSKEVISVTSAEVTLVVMAALLMYALHLMLQRTKLGKAMRAMADNEDLAKVTGIPARRVVLATWVIGGGMAGAAGYLIALERGTVGFNLGWLLLLLIFAAVILGGIGSIYGAMAGGVVIGLTQSVSLVWIPSSFATAAAFAIMILMLLVRPEGLFGGVTTA
ncbi:branched-chain amino acid ABC transporter permease [Halobacteriales archaeon QS_8_69_26]|nr:MAG: branched-chain amino acid ABC transporter permease [Halobacteriales archaeon QS_8_69_26]